MRVWIAIVLVAAALVAAYLLWPKGRPEAQPTPSPEPGWFEDRAAAAGITFQHFDPATPQHLIIETMGDGLGWIDYDADGRTDLLCIQNGPLPPGRDPTKTHHFYRNRPNGTFENVTAAVGLGRAVYGQGCAVGDYDSDGFDDLVITHVGGLSLFHNVPDAKAPGGRRFEDVTAASGLLDPHWATSCAWGDLDGDSLLDLYVCNYVELDPAKPLLCGDEAKGVLYACNPTSYPLVHHKLFRNRGNGRFEDVSASAGLTKVAPAAGLAVGIIDLDGDGRQDIYVANDLGPAHFLHNRGSFQFVDVALPSGTALGAGSNRMSGMCVEIADFDGSGRPSIFVTEFQRKPNMLFLNRGSLRFDDASFQSGLGGPSVDRLKFGACVLDADRDGLPDLVVANGHVQRAARELFGANYAQPLQFFRGTSLGKYADESKSCGEEFLRPRVGRGVARADYDNDGRTDVAIHSVGDTIGFFHNRIENANGWIALDLVGDGKKSNRSAIGSEVLIEAGSVKNRQFVIGGGSYLSANDRRITWGLGTAEQADVTVKWPSGMTQIFRKLAGRQRWKLVEGEPEAKPVGPVTPRASFEPSPETPRTSPSWFAQCCPGPSSVRPGPPSVHC